MRIAIVGSRKIPAEVFGTAMLTIRRELSIEPNPTLVSGGAAGIDSLAEGIARGRGNPVLIFKPEWDRHGKSAGFKRNQKIVDCADQVIAFHFEDSPGTADSIRRAKESRKPLTVWTCMPNSSTLKKMEYNQPEESNA